MFIQDSSHSRLSQGFGCLAFATEVRQVDKFASRAIPAVLIGYSHMQKRYKLYALHSKEFMVSRDFIFK